MPPSKRQRRFNKSIAHKGAAKRWKSSEPEVSASLPFESNATPPPTEKPASIRTPASKLFFRQKGQQPCTFNEDNPTQSIPVELGAESIIELPSQSNTGEATEPHTYSNLSANHNTELSAETITELSVNSNTQFAAEPDTEIATESDHSDAIVTELSPPTLDYLTELSGTIQREDINGRRIISLPSFVKMLENISNHARNCQRFRLQYTGEVRNGLETDLRCRCPCGYMLSLGSSAPGQQLSTNMALAWGGNGSGTGYSDLSTIFTALDIPVPCNQAYNKIQKRLLPDWEKVTKAAMAKAAEEEKRLAILAGDFVVINGIKYPWILVKVDGQWGKRTYGHGYNANCGSAAIIGARTGKILFIGTRTTTCFVCKRADSMNQDPEAHDCFKNWSGPSTAMESDIIAEGFRRSIADYGLVYSRFVGDGDSNVYKNVIDIYPGIRVEKVECSNHLMKNFRKHLINISNNTAKGESIPKEERKIKGITEKFEKISRAVVAATNHYAIVENAIPERWKLLFEDIINIPHHVFGDHRKCKPYFCKPEEHINEPNLVEAMQQTVLWKKMLNYLHNLASKSRSLVEKQNTNAAEALMSVCNKYLEGKRKNFGQRFLYRLRILCAVLSYNTTTYFLADAYSILYCEEPPEAWKKKKQETEKIRSRKPKPVQFRKLGSFGFLKETKGDSNYGSSPDCPDMDSEQLQSSIQSLRNSLQVSREESIIIEQNTVKQSDSELWMEHRKSRITASVAGEIFKMRDSTQNTRVLNKILGRNKRTTEAMRWGMAHEEDARLQYIIDNKCLPGEVRRCGLVVSEENGIFAASSDAFVGNNGLLEIKCPESCKDQDPTEWSVINHKNGIYLKESHVYYNQIVMQLHITQREWCDLVVWTRKSIWTQRFHRNKNTLALWHKMVTKLERFWQNELAPEVLDSRFERNLEYRIPAYRATSQKKTSNEEEEPTPP